MKANKEMTQMINHTNSIIFSYLFIVEFSLKQFKTITKQTDT